MWNARRRSLWSSSPWFAQLQISSRKSSRIASACNCELPKSVCQARVTRNRIQVQHVACAEPAKHSASKNSPTTVTTLHWPVLDWQYLTSLLDFGFLVVKYAQCISVLGRSWPCWARALHSQIQFPWSAPPWRNLQSSPQASQCGTLRSQMHKLRGYEATEWVPLRPCFIFFQCSEGGCLAI